MLSGVYAQPINTWKEALDVKKQLLKDAKSVTDGEKAETVFKTVIVDTAKRNLFTAWRNYQWAVEKGILN